MFASGFTLDAAESVCADDLVDEYAVLELLARLVDKSLVQVDDEEEATRYRLLETIRQSRATGSWTRARATQPATGTSRSSSGSSSGPNPSSRRSEGPALLARMDVEHDNLRAALEWADTAGRGESFLRMVTALTLFFELRGHLPSGARWFERALAADTGTEPTAVRAVRCGARARGRVRRGFRDRRHCAPQALALAEQVGDEWAMARALNTMGYIERVVGTGRGWSP